MKAGEITYIYSIRSITDLKDKEIFVKVTSPSFCCLPLICFEFLVNNYIIKVNPDGSFSGVKWDYGGVIVGNFSTPFHASIYLTPEEAYLPHLIGVSGKLEDSRPSNKNITTDIRPYLEAKETPNLEKIVCALCNLAQEPSYALYTGFGNLSENAHNLIEQLIAELNVEKVYGKNAEEGIYAMRHLINFLEAQIRPAPNS